MSRKPPLSLDLVRPDIDDARAAKQWRGIASKLDQASARRPLGRWAMVGAAAVLVVGAGAFGVFRAHRAAEGAVVGSVTSPSTVALADGSTVVVEPGGRLTVQEDQPRSILLTLVDGSAHFRVAKDATRPFVVRAREVSVRVVGTDFVVALDPQAVRVNVDQGIVEVTNGSRPEGVSRIYAGEQWSTRSPVPPAPPASVEAPSADAGEPEAAGSAVAPQATASANTPAEGASARALFDAANQARRAGHIDAAARFYRALITQFPDDPRAALAAFELSRLDLAMGRDGDAKSSLEGVVRGAPGSSVHEDALAKLVEIEGERGDPSACRRLRDEYLRLYPKGVHATVVRRSCSPP